MIRTILYSVLIMIFLAFLLVSGLLGPQQGKLAFERFLDFINWKPARTSDSLLTDTEVAIRQFNESYGKVQVLRQMTLERSEKSFHELEQVYQETREHLKQLLSGISKLSPQEWAELFKEFAVLHKQRAELVDQIIRDQQIMININEQMDQQLQAMSKWLNDKATQLDDPTAKDMKRMQQYENLKGSLQAFNEQSSSLDSMRILFMKKNKTTIERLAQTNNELENRFRELLSQIEMSTQDQSYELWDHYQKLEAEQKELVGNLRTTEEFISANQMQQINGVTVISKSVEYRSDTQLQRFRDAYVTMEQRRREMLASMTERQQIFVSSQPTRKQLFEDSRYRMELMREHAQQISAQYDQMDEFRKSTASMIQNMTSGLKDKAEFNSRQTKDIMQKSREKLDGVKMQMDSAQREQSRQISDQYEQMEEYRKSATSMLQNMSSELKDKAEFTSRQTDDIMQRSQEKIDGFMVQMDSAQQNIKQFIENSQHTELADNASFRQIKELQDKSRVLLDNMKKNEEQLRSVRVQTQRDQNTVNQSKRDTARTNAERMKNAKERTEDQKRIMSERIKDQMQMLKDKQESQKSADR